MKLVIFGLSVSSSWGNGHATLWRGLLRALARQGHKAVFFEKDVPWYANARDLSAPDFFELEMYRDWDDIAGRAETALEDAEAAIVTSYCPDAAKATALALESKATAKVFYDLDTPVTLAKTRAGEPVEWAGENGYAGFDLVLSYSGGRSLLALEEELHARRALPLYGSVDPDLHHPVPNSSHAETSYALSYLGTYAEDRQAALERIFIQPARSCPEKRFLLGGSQYPRNFPWTDNIFFHNHVAPADHNSFYCSSDLTLNITRQAMVDFGHCPSGRLFEAASCGVPVLTDVWDGLEEFFEPGSEILVAERQGDAVAAIRTDRQELRKIGKAARQRVLECHTADIRAREMVGAIESCTSGMTMSAGGRTWA